MFACQGKKYVGTFLAPPDALQDVGRVAACMRKMVESIGMTTLGTHIYDVPLAVKRLGQHVEHDEGGITAVVVLSTSHAAIHTWPEEGMGRFDVDSCRDFDVSLVDQVLQSELSAHGVQGMDLSAAFYRSDS